MNATEYLDQAAAEMRDRAASRDSEESGERSMKRTVEAFWSLYGDAILDRGYMTETEGWQFMSVLKKARGAQGEYREDDYVDDVAYCSLAAESASDVNDEAEDSHSYRRLGWVNFYYGPMSREEIFNMLDEIGLELLRVEDDSEGRYMDCLLEHHVFDPMPLDTEPSHVPEYLISIDTIESEPYIHSVKKV